ncbi:TPA: phage portal protein, partial [Staphylococcus aureus]
YKLFGLEQVRAIKERLFKKGLMKRYKLLLNKVNLESMGNHDYSELNIVFTPNLPKSLKESVDIFNALSGGVSEETRLSTLEIIDNPKEEMRKMEDEAKKVEQSRGDNEYGHVFDKTDKEVDSVDEEDK